MAKVDVKVRTLNVSLSPSGHWFSANAHSIMDMPRYYVLVVPVCTC